MQRAVSAVGVAVRALRPHTAGFAGAEVQRRQTGSCQAAADVGLRPADGLVEAPAVPTVLGDVLRGHTARAGLTVDERHQVTLGFTSTAIARPVNIARYHFVPPFKVVSITCPPPKANIFFVAPAPISRPRGGPEPR